MIYEKKSLNIFCVPGITITRIDFQNPFSHTFNFENPDWIDNGLRWLGGNNENPEIIQGDLTKNINECIMPDSLTTIEGQSNYVNQNLNNFLNNSSVNHMNLVLCPSCKDTLVALNGRQYRSFSHIDTLKKYITNLLCQNSEKSLNVIYNPVVVDTTDTIIIDVDAAAKAKADAKAKAEIEQMKKALLEAKTKAESEKLRKKLDALEAEAKRKADSIQVIKDCSNIKAELTYDDGNRKLNCRVIPSNLPYTLFILVSNNSAFIPVLSSMKLENNEVFPSTHKHEDFLKEVKDNVHLFFKYEVYCGNSSIYSNVSASLKWSCVAKDDSVCVLIKN